VIRVANAPCSWGVLEFDVAAVRVPAAQMLQEMRAAGYAGTELGDWGFLPTAAGVLAETLAPHRLAMVGAFVPVALADSASFAGGIEAAVRTARLLLAAAGPDAVIVLSDDNASVPERTNRAGRIRAEDGLSESAWDGFASRAQQIAHEVRDSTGLRTVFHHHCAGYVETPQEVEALMARTDAAVLGLCLDTGHFTYGGGDPIDAIHRYADRIRHVHFKDCDAEVAARARAEGWDYRTAVGRGLFCELGRGSVDFAGVVDALRRAQYGGWVVVEQDILPGAGTPEASARRNREYLRRLGL